MAGKKDFLDRALTASCHRRCVSDDWPADIKRRTEEAINMMVGGEVRLAATTVAKCLIEDLKAKNISTRSVEHVARYFRQRVMEARNAK